MADYQVKTVDLSVALNMAEVQARGTEVSDVAVLAISAGASVSLHFGRQDAIPVGFQGQAFEICPPENEGIYVTAPAQPGASVTLMISFGVTESS